MQTQLRMLKGKGKQPTSNYSNNFASSHYKFVLQFHQHSPNHTNTHTQRHTRTTTHTVTYTLKNTPTHTDTLTLTNRPSESDKNAERVQNFTYNKTRGDNFWKYMSPVCPLDSVTVSQLYSVCVCVHGCV